MTFEDLISSPEAYGILLAAWMTSWLLKRLSRGRPFRKDPNFKLLLTVLPVTIGAIAGPFVLDGQGMSTASLALAGAGAAAPATVSYATLRQISELPWLPPPARALLMVLLEREPKDPPKAGGAT